MIQATNPKKLLVLDIRDIAETISNYIGYFSTILESNVVDKIIALLLLDLVTNIGKFDGQIVNNETYSKIIDILINNGFKENHSLSILGFSESIVIDFLLSNVLDLDLRNTSPNISFINDSSILLTL